MFGKLKNYIKESFGELKKISWPKREEIVGSSVVVLVFILILAVGLGVIDIFSRAFVHFVIDPKHEFDLLGGINFGGN